MASGAPTRAFSKKILEVRMATEKCDITVLLVPEKYKLLASEKCIFRSSIEHALGNSSSVSESVVLVTVYGTRINVPGRRAKNMPPGIDMILFLDDDNYALWSVWKYESDEGKRDDFEVRCYVSDRMFIMPFSIWEGPSWEEIKSTIILESIT